MKPLNLLLILLPLFAPPTPILASEPAAVVRPADPDRLGKAAGVAKVATDYFYAPFTINNIFNYYSNNGDGSYNKYSSDNEGFEFPKGSGKHVTFEDGIIWGGFHKGRKDPKVGGSVYRHGMQAGKILTPGTSTSDPVADDPSLPKYRVYRIRPDVNPHTTLQQVRTLLDTGEVKYTGRYQTVDAEALYDQYLKDWNEWPWQDGAPYTDVNGDGKYDPAVDIPGVAGADQTLWYVANDMNPQRTNSLAGSPPIGLEMQRTVWGYAGSGSLGNTIFLRTLLINKSGAKVDSMFLAQWCDPDIGDPGNDFIGCDSARNLGYAYNGAPTDVEYGAAAPACGFLLLEGPHIVSPGDTAWVSGVRRPGFRNLPMTSFVLFSSGLPIYADPVSGYGGDIEWYRLMNGLIASTGAPFINPQTGQSTKFVFPGDPVSGGGWVDGSPGFYPADRRLVFSTGPFVLAAGDTQEIVVAHLAAQGADRLSSIFELETACDLLRKATAGNFNYPPGIAATVAYPTPGQAQVTIAAEGGVPAPQAMNAILRDSGGKLVAAVVLHDDGSGGDAIAGDRRFTGISLVPATLPPLSLDLSVNYPGGGTDSWNGLKKGITVAGPLAFGVRIFSDNLNNDGQLNPGEDIRYGVVTTNKTPFSLTGLLLASNGRHHRIPALAPSAADTMRYADSDPQTYFTVGVPDLLTRPEMLFRIIASDTQGNSWVGDVILPVIPLQISAGQEDLAPSGTASGVFRIEIGRAAELKNHVYVIVGVDSINALGDPGITLRDSTDGRVLLDRHAVPDSLGHAMPLTDGFKIMRGTVPVANRLRGWSVSSGPRTWTWANANALNLEGFYGAIGNAIDYWVTGSTLRRRDLRSVLIKFATADSAWDPQTKPADTNFSRGYRYLGKAGAPPARAEFDKWIVRKDEGYPYQDYNWGVPFSAWNAETTPPVRLAVGHLENNVLNGRVDGCYWPPTDAEGLDNVAPTGPREWFFIFASPYTEGPDTSLTRNLASTTVPMLWLGTPNRQQTTNFHSGDQFLIKVAHSPRAGDRWFFNPVQLFPEAEPFIPQAFGLAPNYPNPFNPGTTIRFFLPAPSNVALRIYDLLGREVDVAFEGPVAAGTHEVQWNARNLASGVYFYRLEATPQDGSSGKMIQTRKMLYIR